MTQVAGTVHDAECACARRCETAQKEAREERALTAQLLGTTKGSAIFPSLLSSSIDLVLASDVCAGAGLTPATSAPGLGLPLQSDAFS